MRFLSALLAALGLAPGAAHVMEMPVKMGYAPELYATVTSSLYAWFGSVGAAVQVAAVLSTAVLAYRSRREPALPLISSAAVLLAASILVWAVLVAPVNAEWARVMQTASEPLAGAYVRLRPRWEYGHVAAFVVWFLGYCVLQLALLRERTE